MSIVLSGGVASLALAYPTEAAAGNQSNHGASVSMGGVSVNAGGGGSVSAGGASVSADRGGASVSAGNTSVSANQGGASVSAGNTSVSANQGGASVSAGNASVSSDRGGASISAGNASVSANQGRASVSAGNASVSANQGGASIGADGDIGIGGSANTGSGGQATGAGRPVGDRSYTSLGAWFADLRSLFGGRSKGSDDMKTTTTHFSSIQTTETSGSGRTQRNRVVQVNSATVIATDGDSANSKTIRQKNMTVTEQKKN